MPDAYVRVRRQHLRTPDNIRKLLPETGVAETNGVPMGCIACDGAFVAELCVDPASQHQGVGRMLMQWAEDRLRIRKYGSISLHCYEANKNALRFYRALGFTVTDLFPSTNVPGGPVTVCLLQKVLPTPDMERVK